ncbi:family 43 glycosylhydrolase [Exilibacterium tricleocarpae]|uniref:Family 43 glycosylhydrolase n=2 Tax=Exilibacterium tricleocarpae TaxID=2591008 RepID=A0A545SQL9_9GAMM|nr:family 43 glycosylhydrolase [Exilibacterium tricleocarpae]
MTKAIFLFLLAAVVGLFTSSVTADNPLVTHMYTADPTARVFNGRLYIFPSTDITCKEGFGNNGFRMPSYNVFSSQDLNRWTDHGLIVDQSEVPWGVKDGFGMWAPDVIEKGGKYYFYFPNIPTDKSAFRRIGVATADRPEGPYTVMETYVEGIKGIDPNIFIDDDKQAYIYWGGGEELFGARLKDNMLELASKPQVIEKLPAKYKEGPFVFKRDNIYYFTFPHAPDGSEELAYATGTSPLGPFEYQGLFMERWRDGQWTNHHSIVEYKNQWYVFYHHHQISKNQHLRSMRADYLFFDSAGRIQRVEPTLRGIGVARATSKIQIDRYSRLSDKHVKVSRRNDNDLPAAWIVDRVQSGGWVNYDRVDFAAGEANALEVSVASKTLGGTLELRLSGSEGELLAEVPIDDTGDWDNWRLFSAPLKRQVTGVKNLSFLFKGPKNTALFSVDWVRFKRVDAEAH